MASTLKIKRSEVSGNPSILGAGELAYSALTDNGSNGGDRLYIGTGTEISGNAVNHVVIGGKYFTDIINAATNNNTASTLIKRDSTGSFSISKTIFTGTTSGAISLVAPATAGTNTITLPAATGTVSLIENKLSVFAATTSAELSSVISDETGTGSLVFATSPTLVTPTITTSITGTGALTIAAGGTNTSITLTPLGTGTVDISSKRITNVADPTQAQDAATKAYVDAVKTGLDIKDSVRAATTTNLTASYSTTFKTLTNTGTLGPLIVDSVTLSANDRVLVKDQTTASINGIYVVTNAGNSSVAWILTRATDFDNTPGTEITSGLFTFVEDGATNSDSGWVLTTNGTITLDTTSLAFSQFSGAGQLIAGAGLTKTGSTIDAVGTANRITIGADNIDIASTYVGQASITTLGIINIGTWQATTIESGFGGTGFNAYAKGDMIYASETNILSKLTAGTDGQFLQLVGGVPMWVNIDGGTF